MNVLALDLSLTATGVADANGTRTIRSTTTGMKRLAEIRNTVLGFADGWLATTPGKVTPPLQPRADIVAIEGYSMGTARQPSRAHALGELGGVVRLALWEACLRVVDVPPSCIKRYAVGKGNAKKAEVYGAAIRRLDYAGCSDDESDALWLRALVLDALGEPIVKMPAANREAVATVIKLMGAGAVAA